MSRTSVTDLKARLSHYLREVRRGGEVEILDHGVPVARLTRIEESGGDSDQERRARLVRAGVLRQGQGQALAVLDQPPLAVAASLLDALEEEREDRI